MIINQTICGESEVITGVSITSPPDITEYNEGDTLDLTGLVVTASCADGTTKNVTSLCSFSPAEGTVLTTSYTSVTITWRTYTLTQAIEVTRTNIYGVSWAGTSSSAMTRTDDAATFTDPVPYVSGASSYSSPFDNCAPWKNITKETISGLGTLVKIPKYWYKWTRSGTVMKLQIADKATEGFYVSPAHADRGDGSGERDYVYVGRYHCGSSYTSVTGTKPKASITRATARSGIHALNSNAWQLDYAMWWTINMLYLVEFADWDSQAKIGYGCGNGSATQNTGASDSMPYHTGTMQSSRTTYAVGCQYRYIEDWWGNVYDWCDGIYFSGSNVYAIKNPANFSDSSGGTNIGARATSSGYIQTWNTPTASGFEYAIYPSGVNSSKSYVCDYCYYSSSGVVLYVGGFYSQGEYHGVFFLNGYYSASSSYVNIGCRLQYLP